MKNLSAPFKFNQLPSFAGNPVPTSIHTQPKIANKNTTIIFLMPCNEEHIFLNKKIVSIFSILTGI